MRNNAKKISIFLIKYIPILCNIALLAMCFESMFEVSIISNSGYFFSGYSFIFIALLFSLSLSKGFCFWHLMLISNMLFSLTISYVDYLGLKIPYVFYIVLITTAASLLITLSLIIWKKTIAKTWS